MTIQEIKATLLKWIKSCDKEEQIDLLTEVIAEFVVKRFDGKEDQKVIEWTMDYLLHEMADQKLIIKRIYFQSLPEQPKTDQP